MQVSQFIIDDAQTREDLEDATCELCKNITIQPTQCQRSHIFCTSCIEEHLKTSVVCPLGHPLLPEHLAPCRIVDRLVSRLKIRCPNSSPPIIGAVRRRLTHPLGCSWTGAVRDLAQHDLLCPFRQVPCSFCSVHIPIVAIGTHTKMCRNGRTCDLCNTSMVTDLDAHYQVCAKAAVYCPNLCHMKGEVSLLRRDQIDAHLKICPRQREKCQFWEVGCQFEGERDAVRRHAKDGLTNHLMLVAKGLITMREIEERVRKIEERLGTPT